MSKSKTPKSAGTSITQQENEALAKLLAQHFPSKVRELHNMLRDLKNKHWGPKHIEGLRAHAVLLSDLAQTSGSLHISKLTQHINNQINKILRAKPPIPRPESLSILEGQLEILQHALEFGISTLPGHLAAPRRVSARILIGSKDPSLIAEISKNFDYFGYSIETQDTVDQLIATIDAQSTPFAFAAIIIDMALCPNQDLNPFALMPTPAPLLFISKNDTLEARLFAVRAGGKAFFKYPIEFMALIEKINALIFPMEKMEPFKVLIIEDSPTQALLIQKTLVDADMIVETVLDKTQMNQKLAHLAPELILMDLYMPNCSGIELASVIRQQEAYVGVPIVFLSSEQDIATQLDAMSLGGDDFLTKPIEEEHLILAVTTRIMRARSLRSEMIQDSLTGLLNHTRILEQLDIEIARAQREKSPLTFVMLDLDHFKVINDTYGHLTGDNVLKNIATLFKQRLRKTDSIGRYGGEEFAIILPQTEGKNILPLLKDIQESFNELNHSAYENISKKINTEKFTTTFSAGIASLSDNITTFNELMQAADKALYQAKNQGRNQIIIAQEPGPTSGLKK